MKICMEFGDRTDIGDYDFTRMLEYAGNTGQRSQPFVGVKAVGVWVSSLRKVYSFVNEWKRMINDCNIPLGFVDILI